MESGTDWLCEILQNVQLEQFYIPIRDQLQVNEKNLFFKHFFLISQIQQLLVIDYAFGTF